MKIRRICIRNFRKLLGPVVIEGLGDGLTVIAGDNEEGKSTILSAVQAAFFDRHRLGGEAAEAMQPFGSAVRPEIGIDFELGGERYTLSKAFCQKPEAELVGPGGRASGDAAEERLRELLCFELPGRGAAKREHRGIWGLFWVEQGTAFTRPQLGDAGRETLVTALESEVGHVLGGERGRALKEAVRQRYETVFTPTGRPKGPYKEVLERVSMLQAELDAIRSELKRYDDKTDELGRLRARLRTYADERSLETAETALRTAREAQTALQTLERALAEAETEEKLARAALSAAQASWMTRASKIKAIDGHAEQEETCRKDLELKADALKFAETERHQRQSGYDAARAHFKTAEAVLDAGERALQRANAKRELDELQNHFGKAGDAKARLDRLRSQTESIRIDDAGMKQLRALATAAQNARLRLQSIATRLRFAPQGGRSVAGDGKSIAIDQPLLLTEETCLTLEGFGDVIVTPGGEDLAPLRREEARAVEELEGALRRLGAADVAEAEKQLSRRTELLAQAGAHGATVKAHAPDGLEALRQKVDLKAAELAELSQGASEVALDVKDAERCRDEARKGWERAKAAIAEAEGALQEAERSHSAMRDAWLTAQTNLTNAQNQSKVSRDALDDERARTSDADLREALRAASEDHRRAVETLTRRRAAVETSNPEEVRLRLEKSQETLTLLKADIDKTTNQTRELEVELRTLGQTGLGELLDEKAGELERARDHAARTEREAKAVRLLLETLSAAERQVKEQFLGPVRERIKPYLKLLLPDTEVLVADDDLAISHLRRDGIDEPFEQLSVGTREQLAVLTRLAFAEFLRDKGRPAAVILDDALAYSDDDRFERMQLVLRKAAETIQVIVLTCRERDYRSLGAPIIRLTDCR